MKPLWNIVLALFCFRVQGTLSDEDCQNPCNGGNTCRIKPFRNTCYYLFNNKPRTWYQSRELCKSKGLTMAKLNEDAIKQNFTIKDLVKEGKNELVWLGGMTPNLPKWTFDSGDSQRANGSDAKTDIQDGTVMDKCGTLRINIMNFKVSVLEESCDIHHQFICRLGEWHNSPVTYISEQSANWSKAKLRCSDMQGDLFYLKPHDNIQHLETKLLSFPGKTFFVGQNHNQLAWKWEDGNEILYYNWLPGESKSSAGSCLMMYSQNGKWKANECNVAAFTLCQNGSTMGTSNHNSRTENSTENKPLEAPVNTTGTSTINTTSTSAINTASTSITTVIICTLGSLLTVSAGMNMIHFTNICLTNAKCRCLTQTQQEMQTTNIVDNNDYTYIEINQIRHIERRLSPTGNDESNPGIWPTVEQEALDQTGEQRNNRQVESAMMPDADDDDGYIVARVHGRTQRPTSQADQEEIALTAESVMPQDVDDNGYLVLISGRNDIPVMPEGQNLEHLAPVGQSESESGDNNSNEVQNEYDHLGASEPHDEWNSGNRNSVEDLYTLLQGARK